MSRKLRNSSACRLGNGHAKSASLSAVVRAYQLHHRPRVLEELESFRAERSFRAAVERAALARRPDGKRYDHQRRLAVQALEQVRRMLLDVRLQRCRTFQELHTVICEAISPIRGVGDLMVYDTAVRIGARLKLEPEHVYLHAGTRAGARTLGLTSREAFIEPTTLPPAFQSLSPLEVEDCLCIFKEKFAQLRPSNNSTQRTALRTAADAER